MATTTGVSSGSVFMLLKRSWLWKCLVFLSIFIDLAASQSTTNFFPYRSNHTHDRLSASISLWDQNYHPFFNEIFLTDDRLRELRREQLLKQHLLFLQRHNLFDEGSAFGSGGERVLPIKDAHPTRDFSLDNEARVFADGNGNLLGREVDVLDDPEKLLLAGSNAGPPKVPLERLASGVQPESEALGYGLAYLKKLVNAYFGDDDQQRNATANEAMHSNRSARQQTRYREMTNIKRKQRLVANGLEALFSSGNFSKLSHDEQLWLMEKKLFLPEFQELQSSTPTNNDVSVYDEYYGDEQVVTDSTRDSENPTVVSKSLKEAVAKENKETGVVVEPRGTIEPKGAVDADNINKQRTTISQALVKMIHEKVRRKREWNLLHITDAHMSLEPLNQEDKRINARMHNAFKNSRDIHLKKYKKETVSMGTSPMATLKELLKLAKDDNVDGVIISGDLVNFPQKLAIDYALQELETLGKPYIFTSGNHDWMNEGKPQEARLFQMRKAYDGVMKPLFQNQHQKLLTNLEAGDHPVTLLELGNGGSFLENPDGLPQQPPGLLVIAIDNSDMQVQEAQRQAVKQQLDRGIPTILVMHHGLHIPDLHGKNPKRSQYLMCGDQKFGWDTDTSYQVEKRERWPKSGNLPSTRDFVDEVLNRYISPRGPVITILAGHEHIHRVDDINDDCKQYITLPGFEGGFRKVQVLDMRSY